MEYIKNSDYEFIMNKYHKQNEPFNSLARFVRNDSLYEENSGLAPDLIYKGIEEQDERLKDLSHPVRKASAFEYILANTRISCDARDIFPCINMIDRPLNKTLIKKWSVEVFCGTIPEVEDKRIALMSVGAAVIWPDYDHSVPIWDRIFDLGFKGLLEQSEKARNEIENITPDQTAFFDGIKITYTAILNFLERLENKAKEDGNVRMQNALCHIKNNPPETFYQALLVDYIYFMLSEHIEGLQVRSLSNFDRLFYKFYKNDLANGVEEIEIRRDLAYFFLQFTAIGNYWNQPVFLGGSKQDETTEINELSYLFLDVYDKMKIYNPKVQIKLAKNTPKEFVLKALDMIRRGHNCIVFVNEATIRKALENVGYTPEQARLCNVKGCYEYSPQGTMGTGMNSINLLKPLEYALHKGCDGVTGKFSGIESPDVSAYKTFEDLFDEYKKQLKGLIDSIIDIVNNSEHYLSYINPQSMLSATYPSCLKTGKDALHGGAEGNGSGIGFGFIADVADSLTAIKKYVFDKKEITLSQLVEMLDNDFKGNENFRQKLLADRDKYGNNKEMPDSFAVQLVDFVRANVIGRPNAKVRGGKWGLGFHVARMSYSEASTTASSPNGRIRGEELSKNMSASIGMNREGATAAVLSITKIDATKFTGDASLDLGLLPSAVKGEDGLEAMYALLMTFVKRGGHAIHINVFDAQTLRDAQAHPEKYQDLQIRVCGWNVLWNNINKEEQDGFIKQAEALI